MEFLNSIYGLITLLYLLIGVIFIRDVEGEIKINFSLFSYVMVIMFWLPLYVRGCFISSRDES